MESFKRFVACILTLALLCLCIGCAENPAPEEPKDTDILLQNWESYLTLNAQIHAASQWAFAYARDYARENDWDSLMKARAAASAALVFLQQLEVPECTLTDAQYDALLAQGIEADMVLTEMEAMPQTLQNKCNTLTLLNYHLIQDVFLTPDAEMIADWVDSSIKINEIDCRYAWNATNYLLLHLKEESLWAHWQEAYPNFAQAATPWLEDPDKVMALTDHLLDQLADELVLFSGYLGTSEYTLEVVREATATGDLTALSRIMNRMEGVPGYFPVPEWLPDVTWQYVIHDPETEEPHLIRAGDEISTVPTACYISFTGISLEQAKDYFQVLTDWGLEPYETGDDTIYQILVSQGDSQMLLKWTAEESVLYLTDPVGSLIPSLYLAALIA